MHITKSCILRQFENNGGRVNESNSVKHMGITPDVLGVYL